MKHVASSLKRSLSVSLSFYVEGCYNTTDMCIYCIYRLYCFVFSVAVLVDLSPENELIYVYKMTLDN